MYSDFFPAYDRLSEGCRESRINSRDNYLESYITQYTSIGERAYQEGLVGALFALLSAPVMVDYKWPGKLFLFFFRTLEPWVE